MRTETPQAEKEEAGAALARALVAELGSAWSWDFDRGEYARRDSLTVKHDTDGRAYSLTVGSYNHPGRIHVRGDLPRDSHRFRAYSDKRKAEATVALGRALQGPLGAKVAAQEIIRKVSGTYDQLFAEATRALGEEAERARHQWEIYGQVRDAFGMNVASEDEKRYRTSGDNFLVYPPQGWCYKAEIQRDGEIRMEIAHLTLAQLRGVITVIAAMQEAPEAEVKVIEDEEGED